MPKFDHPSRITGPVPKDWEDITDIFHYDGARKIKVGQILGFDKDGVRTQIKIMRKTKDGKIWGKKVTTHDMDAVMSHYGHELDVTQNPPYCNTCDKEVK